MTELKPETPQETKERLVKEIPATIQVNIEKMRERVDVIRRFLDRIEDDILLLADEAQKLIFASDMPESEGPE